MPPTSSRPFPPYTEKQRQAQLSEAKTRTKEHGRRVTRHLQASTRVVPHLSWPGLAQVCRLERTTRRNGKETHEVQYAITSLSPRVADASRLLQIWRAHWAIENRLHWVRDATFGEDGCRIRCGHGPHVCSALRNAAINLMRLWGVTNIAAELRAHAIQVERLLTKLGILKE